MKPIFSSKTWAWLALILWAGSSVVALINQGFIKDAVWEPKSIWFLLVLGVLIAAWNFRLNQDLSNAFNTYKQIKKPLRRGILRATLVLTIVFIYSLFIWEALTKPVAILLAIVIVAWVLTGRDPITDPWVKHYETQWKWAFLSLPVILMGTQLMQLAVNYPLEWQASGSHEEQSIGLYTTGRRDPIIGQYDNESEAFLTEDDFSLVVNPPPSFLGFGAKTVTVSMLASGDTPFQLNSGVSSQKSLPYDRAWFYIPQMDEREALLTDAEGHTLYQWADNPDVSLSTTDIETALSEDIDHSDGAVVLNMVPSLNLRTAYKDTLGLAFSTESVEEDPSAETSAETTVLETTSAQTSTLDLSIWGGNPTSFITEVDDSSLAVNLSISSLGKSTKGEEWFNVTILDANETIIEFYKEELTHSIDDETETIVFSYELNNLDSGLYIIRIEPAGEALDYFQNDLPAAHQIKSIESNSPVLIGMAQQWHVAKQGDITYYNLNPQAEVRENVDTNIWERTANPLEEGLNTILLLEDDHMMSSAPIFVVADETRWVMPFDYLVVDDWLASADYLVVEQALQDSMTVDESGQDWYQQSWYLPLSAQEWAWDALNGSSQRPWSVGLQQIKIEF